MNPLSPNPSHLLCERILESITQGIIQVDNEDVIVYANEEFCNCLGYSKEELSGQVAYDFLGKGKSKEIIHEKIENRKKNISEEYEITLYRKNGEPIYFNMKGYPLKDKEGNVIGSIGVHIDVTERKIIEEKLLVSEKINERLQDLVANMNEVFFSYDLIKDKYLFISASCEIINGYTQEEFMNGSIMWLDNIHPDDRHLLCSGPPLTLEKSFRAEYRIIRKDQTICWAEGRFKPVQENGLAVRLDGFISDISKRKEAELLLEQKMNELNTFTYKASHDLRSPLISLRGLIKIASDESKDPKMNKYLGMISESTAKMEANLQELIAVALSKQGELKKSEINFSELLHEIFESIKFLPGFDAVNITTEIKVNAPFYSDKQSLHSILFNLVSNCIKYRNVNIESRVKITIEEDQKHIRISISDNGIGILPEYKEKVFEMFYRATENSSGSGLGLYIVATTLEKLKGKIELKSEYGEGCDFIIHLPVE